MVPIRDMRTIIETLTEHAPIQNDPHELTVVVRVALDRAITQQWFPENEEVQVIGLNPALVKSSAYLLVAAITSPVCQRKARGGLAG